jgi:RNA-directed DNA polymerase
MSRGFSRARPQRSPAWHFRQRQQRRAIRLGYDGYPLRVAQIADKENLYYCWRQLASGGGKAPGADGYTYSEFSPGEVGQIMRDLSEQVLEGVYRAEPVRRVKIPKPGTDKFRTLKISTLCDRVLGKALDIAFKAFWEKRFLTRSYGFRPRRNTWQMLAHLEVAMQKSGRRVLAVDDLKNAFDNVPVDLVIQCHRDALERAQQRNFTREEKNQTLALVEAVLRGCDKGREIGIDQGGPYSPTALNVLLHYHHDMKSGDFQEAALVPVCR